MRRQAAFQRCRRIPFIDVFYFTALKKCQPMSYSVIIFCPDQHILFDASMPDKQGVGGGLMARVRLAQALVTLGHRVTLLAHVKKAQVHQGVSYLPLQATNELKQSDVLIMISSGGALSLESAGKLGIEARLREVWVQGTIPIQGLAQARPDFIIPASNFLHETISAEWGVEKKVKLAVIYNGAPDLNGNCFTRQPQRDSFSLAYTSHPSKGLDAAVGVLQFLRQQEPRFKLHVFGGDALWGGQDKQRKGENVFFHGTQGQGKVLHALHSINFSMNLQRRLEPFGMVLTEAMKQGCIPIASPVGAYQELIKDHYNGFLVPGDAEATETQKMAAELILKLCKVPDYLEYVREQAQAMPWVWERQARVWMAHWDWVLQQRGEFLGDGSCCLACQGKLLLAADGLHCGDCGRYFADKQVCQ
jgi:glycosyltransferase involved in cell wall biosynthesis